MRPNILLSILISFHFAVQTKLYFRTNMIKFLVLGFGSDLDTNVTIFFVPISVMRDMDDITNITRFWSGSASINNYRQMKSTKSKKNMFLKEF